MATKAKGDNFTGLGPSTGIRPRRIAWSDKSVLPLNTNVESSPVSYVVPSSVADEELDEELDKELNKQNTVKQKPNPDKSYKLDISILPSVVDSPPVVEPQVKIDNDLFRRVLFFTIYIPVPFSPLFDKYLEYSKIEGFDKTVLWFKKHLAEINFFKDIETSNDKYNFIKCDAFDRNTKEKPYADAYIGWRFMFNKNDNTKTSITLGRLIYPYHRTSEEDIVPVRDEFRQDMYSTIEFTSDNGIDVLPTIDIYATKKDIDRLSIYVELIEKIITKKIKIEVIDDDLFVDDIKIGYKPGCINSMGNTLRNTCKNICKMFTRAATVGVVDNKTKQLHDLIFFVYANESNPHACNRNIRRVSAGGRNNKTRKRHRNKASHKKMRKSHNIRKRKATGKKRK